MADAAMHPTLDTPPALATLEHRRVRAEWALLHELAACNPARLSQLRADDITFTLRLSATPAAALPFEATSPRIVSQHDVRLVCPRFFPAVPLELYLAEPVFHPNIQPESGFVCLWDRHRASNTAEHALHKLAAMLGWRLMASDALHIMQPAAAALAADACDRDRLADALAAPALTGVTYEPAWLTATPSALSRRRLS